MTPLELGNITISRVVESEGPTPPGFILPVYTEEALRAHGEWMAPHFYNPDSGRFVMSVHTFIVRTRHHTILVDTCVGNDKKRSVDAWNMKEGPFMADLAAAGVTPEQVDFVLCTHLHVDHVGWNTRLENGRWVPTFPNARYLFAQAEWDFWQQATDGDYPEIMRDSVLPIIEAKQADLISGEHAIDDELRCFPTPGHTPGHVSLLLTSGGREAVITGDMMHHPVQMAEPQWSSNFCEDPLQSAATRRAFLERFADRDVQVLGTHFAAPTAGRIVSRGGACRFQV